MYVYSSHGYAMTGQSLPLHRSRYIIAPYYDLEEQVHGKDRPDEGPGIPPGHTDPWVADEAEVFIVNVLDGWSYSHRHADPFSICAGSPFRSTPGDPENRVAFAVW